MARTASACFQAAWVTLLTVALSLASCSSRTAYAQSRNRAVFPGAVITDAQATLQVNVNEFGPRTLSSLVTPSATTVLVSTTGFRAPGIITIDDEHIKIGAVTNPTTLSVWSASFVVTDCTDGLDGRAVVTTSTPHGLTGAERVTITGVLGALGCNVVDGAVEPLTPTTFKLSVSSLSTYLFGGSVFAHGRGFDGSTPATHFAGSVVRAYAVSHQYHQLLAEVQAIEAAVVGSSSPPFADTTALVEDDADATKLLRFELGGLTSGATRVITPKNTSYVLAGEDTTNTFTAAQTMNDWLFLRDGTSSTTIGLRKQTDALGESYWIWLPSTKPSLGDVLEVTDVTGDPFFVTSWAAGGGGGSFYQTLQDSGSDLTQRAKINAVLPIVATDDGGSNRTNLSCPDCVRLSTTQTITGAKTLGANLSFASNNSFDVGALGLGARSIYARTSVEAPSFRVEYVSGGSRVDYFDIVSGPAAVGTFKIRDSSFVDILSYQNIGSPVWVFRGNIVPSLSATNDLGSSLLKFKDLHLSSNVNAAGGSFTSLVTFSSSTTHVGTATFGVNAATTGILDLYNNSVSGAASIRGAAVTGASGIEILGSMYPATSGTADFGLATREWANIRSSVYWASGHYRGPSGVAGTSTTLVCGSGLAVKNITISGGVVTSASCGAP